jgi:hypothetical protein
VLISAVWRPATRSENRTRGPGGENCIGR